MHQYSWDAGWGGEREVSQSVTVLASVLPDTFTRRYPRLILEGMSCMASTFIYPSIRPFWCSDVYTSCLNRAPNFVAVDETRSDLYNMCPIIIVRDRIREILKSPSDYNYTAYEQRFLLLCCKFETVYLIVHYLLEH